VQRSFWNDAESCGKCGKNQLDANVNIVLNAWQTGATKATAITTKSVLQLLAILLLVQAADC